MPCAPGVGVIICCIPASSHIREAKFALGCAAPFSVPDLSREAHAGLAEYSSQGLQACLEVSSTKCPRQIDRSATRDCHSWEAAQRGHGFWQSMFTPRGQQSCMSCVGQQLTNSVLNNLL